MIKKCSFRTQREKHTEHERYGKKREIKETPKSYYHHFSIALGQLNNVKHTLYVVFFLREKCVHTYICREKLLG